MAEPREERQVREFYERWSPWLLTLGRLLLADADLAEEVVEQSFVQYVRRALPLEGEAIPAQLLRAALEAARKPGSRAPARPPENEELEEILRLVPYEPRAAFILRSVLEVDLAAVALAMGKTSEEVNGLWMQALMQVRQMWLKKA